MKLVSAEQMRDLDRRTIEEFGTPGEELMERAGQGAADVIRRTMDQTGFIAPFVHLFAGRGNNGGDAFAVARILKESGCAVEVWLAGMSNELKGDALKHFSRMKGAEVGYRELATKDDWDDAQSGPGAAEILVDGILGIGAKGPARGPVAGAIQYVNSRGGDSIVVSLDVPSGLDADTGQPHGEVVHADITVTMGLPKTGLLASTAREYVGALEVVDIGIPWGFVEETECDPDLELIYTSDLKPLFPRRPRDAHKGHFGRVLLIGGARGYAGAITMAARAAVRSGAGLVTALVPRCITDVVAAGSLEAMVYGAPETSVGSLSTELLPQWRPRLGDFDAVLIGPGLTLDNDSLVLVREVIRESPVPIIIDADALGVLENQPEWFGKAQVPVVMTPHPGELAMLFGQEVSEVQRHREGMALAAAKFTAATVVLKGAGTVVAHADKPTAVNLTGNPGMATGGTGDVLAGLLTGLVGQGLGPYDAARAAVYLHGRAGDLAAWRKSQHGMNASDLIEELPYAFREVTLR